MGIVPIWGFQLLVGIPLAVLFRLNKVLFITAANISIPPMIPLIIYFSYYLGGFFVSNDLKFQSMTDITLQSIHANFVQYATGACVLALITGIFFMALTYITFLVLKFKNRITDKT